MTPVLLLDRPTSLVAPPPEDATRREFITGVGAAALAAAFLAACGEDEAADATLEAATRTIDDLFGPVTIPTHPQRVIAGDWVTMGNMLTLGFKPVGAVVNHASVPSYFADQTDGITDLSTSDGPDIEEALTLDPDLIIQDAGASYDTNVARYEQWKSVGATFGYEGGYADIEDLERNLTEVARALGSDGAQQLIADYDERVAALTTRVVATGIASEPVSVLRVIGAGNYSIRIGTSESIAFRALGIAQPDGQQDPDDFAISISEENLNILNSAHTLFVWANNNAAEAMQDLVESAVWQSLEAVRQARVHEVDAGVWNSKDMVGLGLILDDIERLLVAPRENA